MIAIMLDLQAVLGVIHPPRHSSIHQCGYLNLMTELLYDDRLGMKAFRARLSSCSMALTDAAASLWAPSAAS